jgi:hypothetical protein
MPKLFVVTAISRNYPDIARNPEKYFFRKEYNYLHRHFFPFGRANLTTSSLLQPIRSIQIQLHGPLACRCSNLGP